MDVREKTLMDYRKKLLDHKEKDGLLRSSKYRTAYNT